MPYHHYVSAFHLAQFTTEPQRGRDARIHVLNLERRARYATSVRRAGGEGAYNAVRDVPGLDDEGMEALFEQRYERPAAPVLRAVNETLALPRGRDLEVLVEYFALLAVNNPARRRANHAALERLLYRMAEHMVARPETFAEAQAACRRDGVPVLGEIGYDELRAALEARSLRYDAPPDVHLRGLGFAVDDLAALLWGRTWSLLVADPDAPDFACGDNPVTVVHSVERGPELLVALVPWPNAGNAFAMRDTGVVVPLGRRVALQGFFGGTTRRVDVGRNVVAEVNRRAIGQATAYVYSAEPTFTFWDVRQNFRVSAELLGAERDGIVY